MVQLSLRKVGCLAGLLALVLLVVAFLALFTDVGRQIHDIMYDELYRKLNKILGGKDIGEKYVDEADFERHADALIALALLYGDVLLRRKSFGGFF